MSTFLEVLGKAARSLNRLTEQVKTVRRLADIGRLDTALDYAAHLADTAERLTLLTRALPCYTGRPLAKEDVRKVIREAIPVKIGFTAQGWFSLRIPPLRLKRRKVLWTICGIIYTPPCRISSGVKRPYSIPAAC